MERVNTALRLWAGLVDAFLYPLGAVPGYQLYIGKLLLGQKPEELCEHRLPVPFVSPDHLARVMVDDNRDVLVPFLVAGFIYANPGQVFKTCRGIRVKLASHSADDWPHRVPGYPKKGCDSRLGACHGKPCGKCLEFPREP